MFSSIAYAQTATGSGASGFGSSFSSGGWQMIVMMVLLMAVLYFLTIRPQKKQEKKHTEMIDSLQRGDKVLTAGGIYGTVSHVRAEEGIVVVKISDDVKVEFAKASVQAKVS